MSASLKLCVGAECWTDHRLVISKLKLRIKPKRRPQGKKAPKRLNTSKLKEKDVKENLIDDLTNELEDLQFGQASVEKEWAMLRDKVYEISHRHLGPASRKHQDWFDDNDKEIRSLLERKKQIFLSYQLDPKSTSKKTLFINIRREIQGRFRIMQNQWLSARADEIQHFADIKDMKKFYDALRAIYGPQLAGTAPLLAADGSTLITERESIRNRWAEHFESVLNRPSFINQAAIDRLPQTEINHDLDHSPTIIEVEKAIKQLTQGRSPGTDAIPAEIYKAGSDTLTQKLTDMFQSFWSKSALPQAFKDASIINLYKGKGNRQSCDNHRGISLLSIAGKIFARVLLNRLTKHEVTFQKVSVVFVLVGALWT